MTLISEAEALQHCHIARDGTSLSFNSHTDHTFIMWMTTNSERVPATLSQKPMQQSSHRGVKEHPDSEGFQVGRENALTSNYHQHGKTFIIYKQKLFALMRKPMCPYEKLAILLPCRMGFRAAEVGTWKAEYIDFQNMETLVLDCKKKILFHVILDRTVAKLAEEVLQGREVGYVLSGRSRSKEYEGKPISGMTVWHIWKKHTDLSPLDGRRGFAALWYHVYHKSIPPLQVQMRHTTPGQTLEYVERMLFWEDIQSEFNEFQNELDLDLDGFPLGDIEELMEAQTP